MQELNTALELRNRFIRETFGSYLSDEIVDAILENGWTENRGGKTAGDHSHGRFPRLHLL